MITDPSTLGNRLTDIVTGFVAVVQVNERPSISVFYKWLMDDILSLATSENEYSVCMFHPNVQFTMEMNDG